MAADQSQSNLESTTTFFDHKYTAISVTLTICCALTLYNACELLLLIATTFKRYAGLYFWSLLVATLGLLFYAIGIIIGYFELSIQLTSQIILAVGWPMMVTGQGLVLYSRLGIVLGAGRQKILKYVKWMIIFNGVVFYISTEVLVLGTFNAKDNRLWAEGYRINEYIQMTFYSGQELILSGIYLWCAVGILRNLPYNGKRTKIMRELFAINVIIVVMEVALLTVEYQNRHVIEQSLKGFVYSAKLKLEFAVLSRLIAMTHRANADDGITFQRLEEANDQRFRSSSAHGSSGGKNIVEAGVNAKCEITHVERVASSY